MHYLLWRKILTNIVGICVVVNYAYTQIDTLIEFDAQLKIMTIVSPKPFDTTILQGSTKAHIGSHSGTALLPLTTPTETAPGAGFTALKRAASLFAPTDYPVRTAVKLLIYTKNGIGSCSGIMVGKNLVLTASHCVYGNYDQNTSAFCDSVIVFPAFDEGRSPSAFNSSVSTVLLIPKKNIQFFLNEDIALVKLRDPIGFTTGWVGIGFEKSDSVLKSKVYHKFSYPATTDPTDTSRHYNGDTMYYNYGLLDIVTKNGFGYYINGIQGQSGSSLFTLGANGYYSIGVQSWSGNSIHFRPGPGLFFALKEVIDISTNSVSAASVIPYDFQMTNVFPNPFNGTASISYTLQEASTVHIAITDMLGRREILWEGERSAGSYRQHIDGSSMASGSYIVSISVNGKVRSAKFILMK